MSVETPLEERREIPQKVEIGIRGSELCVVGDFDSASNIITNAKIEHRPGNLVPDSPVGLENSQSESKVMIVESEADLWQLHLSGYDENGSTCTGVDAKHWNPKTEKFDQWGYVLTDGDGPSYPSTNIVFSKAQGYMMPIFDPNKDGVDMQGKRLIAVEPRGQADNVGVVAPGIRYNPEKGIEVIVQSAKNHTPELKAFETIRAVRASVDKPDYEDIIPLKDVAQIPLYEVDLHPDLIASADPGTKLRVKNFGFVYVPEYVPPADRGQSVVPLKEYLNTSADGVGFAAEYQLFTTRYADHLGTHEPGMNNEEIHYPTNPEESYGKPIRIGLVKGENTWRVVVEDDPKGKFNREGRAIPAIVGRNFDPSTINEQQPIQVHTLKPVNLNNAREIGTNTSDGLHPVEIYVYEASEATKAFATQTLCDFKMSGDGPTQMGLMEWMGEVYGDVFNRVEAKKWAPQS